MQCVIGLEGSGDIDRARLNHERVTRAPCRFHMERNDSLSHACVASIGEGTTRGRVYTRLHSFAIQELDAVGH
jgi:hypothetical protein